MSQISFALIKFGAVINISTHAGLAWKVSKKLKPDINKRLHIIIVSLSSQICSHFIVAQPHHRDDNKKIKFFSVRKKKYKAVIIMIL